jgi:hypothetical protein
VAATAQAQECSVSSGFAVASATPRGHGLELSFTRTADGPATVDVFQVSQARRVFRNLRVAHFVRSVSFSWNGGHARDGVYFVRYRIFTKTGPDVRTFPLVRRNGRFASRPRFQRRPDCSVLASFRLNTPAFGGTSGRRLRMSYRLNHAARVTLTVLHETRTVRVYREAGLRDAQHTYHHTLPLHDLPHGDYRVQVLVRTGATALTASLSSLRV